MGLTCTFIRAGDRIRTGDPHLGKKHFQCDALTRANALSSLVNTRFRFHPEPSMSTNNQERCGQNVATTPLTDALESRRSEHRIL